MTSDALIREREARAYAYTSALAARDALTPGTADYRRAEARLGLALGALEHWGDPIPPPAPPAPRPLTESATPEVRQIVAPFPSGVADPVEAIAARILASDKPPDSSTETEVDAVAMRIAAAPFGAEAPARIKKGDGPKDAEDIVRKPENVEDVARRILNS